MSTVTIENAEPKPKPVIEKKNFVITIRDTISQRVFKIDSLKLGSTVRELREKVEEKVPVE